MRLIGLTGKRQVGKDSTYLAIKAAHPDLYVERISFADRLKEVAAESLGIEGPSEDLIKSMDKAKEFWRIQIHNQEPLCYTGIPEWEITGRQFLQFFGQACRDYFGEEFWVDQVLPRYTGNTNVGSPVDCDVYSMYPHVDIACITDVRHANEASRIIQLGGEIWEVKRPGFEKSSDKHITEQRLSQDFVSLVLINDGTLDDLNEQVKMLV